MSDCFPQAAVRHYKDAALLHREGRCDNAMYHYAFSAECAIKTFYAQNASTVSSLNPASKLKDLRTHDMVARWKTLQDNQVLLGVLSPNLMLKIGSQSPPPALFDKHPDRRYSKDGHSPASELNECAAFAADLVDVMIDSILDGSISTDVEQGKV